MARCSRAIAYFFAMMALACEASAASINVVCKGVEDTIAVNKAIAAFNSPAGSSSLSFSGSKCVVKSLIPITNSGLIEGTGGYTLESISPTGDVFAVLSDGPVVFRDIWIAAAPKVMRRSGAGIRIAGASPGSTNMHSRLNNVTVDGMYDGVVLERTAGAVIANSYISNSRHAGVVKINTSPGATDAGDDSIQGSTLDSADPDSTATAILQFAGGGLRLTNNKILRHRFGYALDLRATTSDLIIVGNSFENQIDTSVRLSRHAPARFFNVVISANQFALSRQVLTIAGDSDWLQGVTVTGNSIGNLYDPKAPAALDLKGGADIIIQSNVFSGNHASGSVAISLGNIYPIRLMLGINEFVPGSYANQVSASGNKSFVSAPAH